MTNTNLLRERINQSGYKLRFVAKQLGISYQCLLNKMNNYTEFKASEITSLRNLLKITDYSDFDTIFFSS